MTMTNAELSILHTHLHAASRFLEFGAGASTLYAASVPCIQQIDSVESSKNFINDNLKPHPVICDALALGKLQFHVIDIGTTSFWGYPTDFIFKKHRWPNYSFSVFTKKSEHDLVLIDGRFRVACTLNCILNTPDDCTIIIHDFWNRPDYHSVLAFLEVQDKADTLGVFVKKKAIDRTKILALIKKYQYEPREIFV